MKEVIKILAETSAQNNICTDGILRLTGINNLSDVDGDVLMTRDCYLEVFKTRKKNAENSLKRLSIVKISANGHSIYRAYRSVSAKNFLKSHAALSPNSIMLLNDNDGKAPKEVKVEKGSTLPFYWYHPDKAIRISIKLGLISLFLGFISIVVSIVGLF